MTWLPIHRRLAIATGLLLAAAAATYYLLILPLKRDNQATRDGQTKSLTELRGRGFPTVPAQLRTMQTELGQQGSNLQVRMLEVYDKAMSQFGERVLKYDSVLGFRKSITQLDYQEKYNAVRRELAERRVVLLDDVLKLTEQSTSPQTYQLMVQLWTVHDLAVMAVDHHLDLTDYAYQPPGKVGEERYDGPRPARLTVEPVRSYAVSDKEEVYMEEYPVRLTVTGSPVDLTAFLADLTAPGHFLPLDTVVIKKLGMENPSVDRVEATLVCSGFLILTDRSKFQVNVKTQQRHNVPKYKGGI